MDLGPEVAASLLTRHLELLPKSAHYYFLLPPTDSPEPSRPARDLFKLEFFEKESVKYRITMLSSVAISAVKLSIGSTTGCTITEKAPTIVS